VLTDIPRIREPLRRDFPSHRGAPQRNIAATNPGWQPNRRIAHFAALELAAFTIIKAHLCRRRLSYSIRAPLMLGRAARCTAQHGTIRGMRA
jgi:hypothetical protein